MNDDIFPHAILEIDNPENLILFKKVIIPSSLGDETQTPPYPGKYANVLMVYEANGHSYLYSSDGIPTALGFDSGGILVVDAFPELEQAATNFLYIKRDTGEAQITTDNQNWTIIAGHYGAVYAVDAQPNAADAEPDSLYVNYTTGEAWLTHDNATWITVNETGGKVLLVDAFPDVADARLDTLYISSADQEARITGDNIHWVTISGGGGGGTTDFDQLTNRPKYAGQVMTSATDIPDFASQISSLSSSLSRETQARIDGDSLLQQEFNAIAQTLQDDVDVLETQMANKVDKVAGKGLSTNDFTNAYKNILDNYDPNAEENVIEVVQRNGVALPITNKTVNVTVPTLVSQLTNDSNFVDNTTFTNALDLKVDKVAGKGLSTNDFTNAYKGLVDTAIQPSDLNYTVMTDLSLPTNPSTTSVVLTADKVNLSTGTTSDKEIALPVASTTQAGIINKATYDTIQDNAEKIEAILGGAVAIAGIAANPTQAALTTAWKTETGKTTVINGAKILDTTNSLEWTYYENDNTWHSAGIGATVTIDQFTNSALGTIKGSTTVGQVFAEANGTGSVNGWDALTARVTTLESGITSKVDKETGKGLSANDFTTVLKNKLDGIEAGAEVNIIEKVQRNGVDLAITNKTVNVLVPTKTSDLTNDSNFVTTTAMNTALNNKVDKVTGKGLSTNDFTDAFKTKLEGIEAGAQVNSPLYSTTGSNTNGAMTQAATTNAIALKLSHGNLTTSGGLEKTVTGSGTNTAIDVKISDGGVTTTKIADANVTTAKIANANVTTAKIADANVTTAKIANNAVTTAKIADGNVTKAKFAQYAVNQAIMTEPNLSPTNDTTAAWKTLYGNNGYYITYYSQTGKFTNQPSQYGHLETIISGTEIYQRWEQQSSGAMSYRAGNATGWYGNASSAGTFRKLIYSGEANSVTTAMVTDLNVTTGKLANGAVTGVANNATSIGTAKLALNTVGTPNLRNQSVTSDKIDWTTIVKYYSTKRNFAIPVNETTGTIIDSYAVTETGLYLVMVSASAAPYSAPHYFNLNVSTSNSSQKFLTTANRDYYASASFTCTVLVNSGDTINLSIISGVPIGANDANQMYTTILKIS